MGSAGEELRSSFGSTHVGSAINQALFVSIQSGREANAKAPRERVLDWALHTAQLGAVALWRSRRGTTLDEQDEGSNKQQWYKTMPRNNSNNNNISGTTNKTRRRTKILFYYALSVSRRSGAILVDLGGVPCHRNFWYSRTKSILYSVRKPQIDLTQLSIDTAPQK